jgi:hypothetical protein
MNRKLFEDFLLKYKDFVNQIVRKYGSSLKGYGYVEMMLSFVLDSIEKNTSEEKILNDLQTNPKLSFLKINTEEVEKPQKDFNTATKSDIFLKTALEKPLRCQICDCLIHKNTMTFDHVKEKKDGGLGTIDYAQLSHPYCNSTYKAYKEKNNL